MLATTTAAETGGTPQGISQKPAVAGIGQLFQQRRLLRGVEASELLFQVGARLLDAPNLRLLLRRELTVELVS